jgi:hypothetical protein
MVAMSAGSATMKGESLWPRLAGLPPEPPEWDGALRFRQWAFESAALDLALRQAGRSLHDVLGLTPSRCGSSTRRASAREAFDRTGAPPARPLPGCSLPQLPTDL